MPSAITTSFLSPLHEMTQTTPTCLWNDSASMDELRQSMDQGGVGATCNPVIAVTMLKQEMPAWKSILGHLASALMAAICFSRANLA